MKVEELIDLLSKEDRDAEVVMLDDIHYFSVESIRKMVLQKTLIRDRSTNELFPGYKDVMKSEEGERCIELRRG